MHAKQRGDPSAITTSNKSDWPITDTKGPTGDSPRLTFPRRPNPWAGGSLSCPTPFTPPAYPPMRGQAAPADYSPVAQVSSSLSNYLGLPSTDDEHLAGALRPDKSTPISLIEDGSSHTILVAEIAGKNDLWIRGKNWGEKLSGFFGGQGGWADATSAASSLFGSTEDGSTSPGSCGINRSEEHGLYSFHRGTANSLLVDGSARVLTEDIETRILVGLITRAGGEGDANTE